MGQQLNTVDALIKSGGGTGPRKPGNQSGESGTGNQELGPSGRGARRVPTSHVQVSSGTVPSPTPTESGKDESGGIRNFSHHEKFFVVFEGTERGAHRLEGGKGASARSDPPSPAGDLRRH